MATIKDVIYIKNLEQRLKRRLTEYEMDGMPFMARFPDGHYEDCCVPLLRFPHDLLPDPSDPFDEMMFASLLQVA